MVNDDAIVGIVVESMSNLDMLKEQHNREVEELKNEINDLKNKVCHRPFRCPRLSCRSRLSCRPSRYPHGPPLSLLFPRTSSPPRPSSPIRRGMDKMVVNTIKNIFSQSI